MLNVKLPGYKNYKAHLLSGTAVLLLTGSILLIAPDVGQAAAPQFTAQSQNLNVNPTAQPRPNMSAMQLASGCSPCNPCAVKKVNPCNPCGTSNPCAASNPCATANPCAAANPCGAVNPCNPCSAADVVDINPCEAMSAYKKIEKDRQYAKSGLDVAKDYPGWRNFSSSPYQSATHGGRYVNNFVNDIGAEAYAKFEEIGKAPVGSIIAKDSFTVKSDGGATVGPLFIMEKMAANTSPDTADWRYTMVMPDGSVAGTTGGEGSANVKFCHECHEAVGDDQDYLFFLPEEFRK